MALEELVLTRNRLSSLTKGLFRDLKGLTTLELNRNRFVEIQVREIILVKKNMGNCIAVFSELVFPRP